MNGSCVVHRASWVVARGSRVAISAMVLALLAHWPTGRLAAQERTIPLDRDGFVRVFNRVGTIHVVGWGVDSVRWNAQLAPGQELYGGGNQQMAKLGVSGPDGVARLEVRVPAGAKLVIDAGESTVDVVGVTGAVEIRGGGGAVHVAGTPVRLTIETVDGPVDITGGPHRSVDVRTAGGAIDITGAREELSVSSISGDVTITADSITRGRIISVTGTVRLVGSVDRTGTLTAESHGGDLELALSTRPGFDVVATAIGGTIVNTLSKTSPRPVRDGRGSLLEAVVGDGGGTVTVTAFKGTIRLTRR